MSELSLQAYRKDPNSYSHIKDPVSTLTHIIGFILSIFSTPLLLSKAGIRHSDIVIMAGLSIYCLSMIVLYGASSAYHAFLLPEKGMKILRKIDHISIFFLIAGTYTPICLILLGKNGKALLLLIWILAIAGMTMKLFWIDHPKYISSILYISMGWLALIRIKDIYHALNGPGFFLLLFGGLLYTIGGIIYALKIRINDKWSEHEIFHIFVLLGSLCHFLMIYLYII